jgi:hypothetical protein
MTLDERATITFTVLESIVMPVSMDVTLRSTRLHHTE